MMPHFGHVIAEAIVDVVVVDVRVDAPVLLEEILIVGVLVVMLANADVLVTLLSQAWMPSAHV